MYTAPALLMSGGSPCTYFSVSVCERILRRVREMDPGAANYAHLKL